MPRLDHRRSLRIERVEPGRDQRVEGLGHVERVDCADGDEAVVTQREQAAVEQHPHRLDRVERNAVRALADRLAQRVRQPGREPVQEGVHRGAVQWFERERGGIPCAAPEVGVALGNSGRARATTAIGCLRDQSRR